MFLLEPNETAYDWRFNLFGVPVRVSPMFWLVMALMGNSALQQGVQYLLSWVACAFVSILVHELGHVGMGAAFGSRGHIVLYGFGGLAIGSNRLRERWQRIAVSFAGPAAGFLFLAGLLGAMWLLDPVTGWGWIQFMPFFFGMRPSLDAESSAAIFDLMRQRPLAFDTIQNLIQINLFWGLINLLPVFPLDGGQISKEVCEGISPRGGMRTSLILSIIVAGVIAIHCLGARLGVPTLPWPPGSVYTAVLFGMLAFQNYQMLQQVDSERRWVDDHWRR